MPAGYTSIDRGRYRNLKTQYDAKVPMRKLVRTFGLSIPEIREKLLQSNIKRRRNKRYMFSANGRRRVGVAGFR